jgi:hypothetical protein
MSFGSLPRSEGERNEKDVCGKTYTEYDGREGAFDARCTRPKGHYDSHGWGSPDEWAAFRARKRGQYV